MLHAEIVAFYIPSLRPWNITRPISASYFCLTAPTSDVAASVFSLQQIGSEHMSFLHSLSPWELPLWRALCRLWLGVAVVARKRLRAQHQQREEEAALGPIMITGSLMVHALSHSSAEKWGRGHQRITDKKRVEPFPNFGRFLSMCEDVQSAAWHKTISLPVPVLLSVDIVSGGGHTVIHVLRCVSGYQGQQRLKYK